MNIFPGRKTYVAAAGLVVAAIVGFLHGDATLADSVVLVLNALGLAGLRNAID